GGVAAAPPGGLNDPTPGMLHYPPPRKVPMSKVYLDHAATTPLDPEVLEAMLPYLKEEFGNPSSVHAWGREARAALERSREKIAFTLNADLKEIVFTSGGTESVNAVHKGVAWASPGKARHFIVSAVEHSCVAETAEWLTNQGYPVTTVGCDAQGWVDPEAVRRAIRPGETRLVSVMAANNEVGTLQSVREIGRLCREQGVLFHTDAVQAYGKVPLDVQKDFIDFLSVSGHKIYGPKGSGFLYQRRGLDLVPLIHGGGQERDRRGGTENVAALVGLGEAAWRICNDTAERDRLRALTGLFLEELGKSLPAFRLNGPDRPERRLPGLVNITLPGMEGETLVHSLDAKGFAASSGPACSAGAAPPSRVLTAMGRSPKEAKQGLRLSFGRSTGEAQVKLLAGALPGIVEQLSRMASFLDE
ncbi:MAG TPA: cysteine desulfurase family protein, partial [bacterium]|nr:cysteine desulfurase family protein [bacterium]